MKDKFTRPYLLKITIPENRCSNIVMLYAESVDDAQDIIITSSIFGDRRWKVEWVKQLKDICDNKDNIYWINL